MSDESSLSESEDAFTGTLLYGGGVKSIDDDYSQYARKRTQQQQSHTEGDEDKIQIRFISNLPTMYHVPNTPFDVPARFTRLGLSEVINHLLCLKNCIPFDFLINGEFLRSSLQRWREKQATEQSIITVEYVMAIAAPTKHQDSIHRDWIKSVHSMGQFIVSASFDGSISLFSKNASGLSKPLNVISMAHGSREPWDVKILSANNDDELTILSGGKDCCMKAWRLSNGAVGGQRHHVVQSMRIASQVLSVASTPENNDKCVAGCANGSLYFFDLDWDAEQTVELAEAALTTPLHRDQVTGLSWISPQRLVSCSMDKCVKLLDIDSGITLQSRTITHALLSVAVPNQDTAVVALSDGLINLVDWREQPNKISRKFKSHKGMASSVAMHSDGFHFSSGGYDGETKLWDIRSSVPLFTLPPVEQERVLCTSLCGNAIVTGGTNKVLRCFEDTEALQQQQSVTQ